MKKMVALISHIPTPRTNRRMIQLKDKYNITVIYWNKGGGKCSLQNIKEVEQDEVYIKANSTEPLKRVMPTLKFGLKSLMMARKNKPSIIYAERFDMLVIACVYQALVDKKIKIIYEVPDLPHLLIDVPSGIKEKIAVGLLKKCEKLVNKKVDILIVTSKAFWDEYYYKFFDYSKVVCMPNIPNFEPFKKYKRLSHKKFTVGFIGIIRYPKQLKMLINVSRKLNINVLFAGFTEKYTEIKRISEECENITYYGQYDYDKEISELYSKCDAIFSMYDVEMRNVELALPNKLYEAIYCKLPIIVSKGTYLAQIVEKYNIGLVVDSSSEIELETKLSKLVDDFQYYRELCDNCENAKELNDYLPYITELENALERLE